MMDTRKWQVRVNKRVVSRNLSARAARKLASRFNRSGVNCMGLTAYAELQDGQKGISGKLFQTLKAEE
ncbi:MAG: hypothetical protein WB780_20430 [Candidatus Acidiferrales bacterium]